MTKPLQAGAPGDHSPNPSIEVAPEVAAALAASAPVVALESTLITHGLARPRNLEVAMAAEAAVRGAGATPATICVRAGRLAVGLDESGLAQLAEVEAVTKVSRQNLAHALAAGGWGGTTVSATMIAARLAGIRVFATGGIGGVHRDAARTFDISADLDELARTPVVVVCSGPKSILDIDLTLEILETRGVPLMALGTRELPGFYSTSSGRTAPLSVSSPDEAAAVAIRHWSLGLGSGLIVAVPVPPAAALPFEEAAAAIDEAINEADQQGIVGTSATPWLLARVAELTGGRSTEANVALIENNALVAARIAGSLSRSAAAR